VSAASARVLYVDDELPNLVAFKYALGDEFDVVTVRTPAEALAELARGGVGVLLTDQRMPAVTGVQLCALAHERHPEVVRMIVTAYADLSAVVDAINSGHVDRYLFKPWAAEVMRTALADALESFERAAAARRLRTELLRSGQESTGAYLAGRVLHELGTPLSALAASLGRAAALADDLGPRLGGSRGEVLEDFEDLHAAVLNSARIVRDLATRIDHLRQGDSAPGAADAATDPNRAVEAALALFDVEARRGTAVETELGDVPPVRAEAVHLSHILVNLIANALESDAPPAGQPRRISLRTRCRDATVVIEVRDNGAGMTAAVLTRACEPFFSTKRDGAPRGLGLAVVRDLARRLGGDIRIASEAGQGSCVTVELPAATAARA
jgi:two-component system, NtrC family, sensor kinase